MKTELNRDGHDAMMRPRSMPCLFWTRWIGAWALLISVGCAFTIGPASLASPNIVVAPPKIVCTLSEEEIFLGESIILQVDVQNVEKAAQPELPELGDSFDVEFLGQQAQQSSTMIVNGRIIQDNQSVAYQYRLTPKIAGDLKIPAVSVTADGKPKKSNSVSVRVREIPIQDTVVAEIIPSHRRIYPTQSLTVKLKILVQPIPDSSEEPLKPLRRSPPSLQINWLKPQDGLVATEASEWLQPLLGQNNIGFTINDVSSSGSIFERRRLAVFDLEKGREKRAGLAGAPINYFVYELDRTLECQKVGSFTFGPATIKGTFVTGISGGQYDAAKIIAIAPAVQVEVSEVPTPRPSNFIGGIGDYLVNASATPSTLRVGDPMTLSLEFAAGKDSGSLELISAPDLSAVPEIADQFEIVDKSPVGRTEKNSKKFAFALRPKRAGVSIPPLALATFDPNSESFKSIATEAIPITVTEATTIAGGDLVGSVGSTKSTTEIKSRAEGIFHNVTDATQLRDERVDLMNGLKWIAGLWIGSGIAIATLFVVRKQSSDVPRQRRNSARRTAQSRLAVAGAALSKGNAKDSLREVRSAILGLVADTSNRNADGLTSTDVANALRNAGVPSDDQSAMQKCLERIESAEYGASDASDSSKLVKDAAELVARVAPFLERGPAK